MSRVVYAEKVLAELFGVSRSLLKKAATGAGVTKEDRILMAVKGVSKKIAVYTVPGIRQLVRWLSDEKNAPRTASAFSDLRLAPLLEGAEVRDGAFMRCEGKKTRPLELGQPGGFPMPEVIELSVSIRESRNKAILLCCVSPENQKELRAAFEQRDIDVKSLILRVLVVRKDHFRQGMTVPVRWRENDLFECVAERMPRRPGRW